MPTYQYRCSECGQDLEVVQKFSDAALTECPACGGNLRKVYNAVGVVFKGSGFYSTDSRSGNGSKSSSSNGSDSSGSSDGGSSGGDSSSNGSSNGSSDKSSGKSSGKSDNSSGSSSGAPAKAAAS